MLLLFCRIYLEIIIYSALCHQLICLEKHVDHMHVYCPLLLKSCRAVEKSTVNYIKNEIPFEAVYSYHIFSFTLLNDIKSNVKITLFPHFPFSLTLLSCLPWRDKKNSLGSTLFIIYDQTHTFSVCKTNSF